LFQNNFAKYVDDQNIFDDIDNHLMSRSFSNVEELNSYWGEKVRLIFNLEDFEKRLGALLVEINCPWDI
jgi:hypothetical protein